jgi:radical SAM protein
LMMDIAAVGPRSQNSVKRLDTVVLEVSRACDLACAHCPVSAPTYRSPLELTTVEIQSLIEQIAAMRVPLFVLSGGDPLKRPDTLHLAAYANGLGLRTSITLAATPLLRREVLTELQLSGLTYVIVSLDGSTPELHDAYRGVPGSFEHTLDLIGWAREQGLTVEVDTLVTRHNFADLKEVVRLLQTLDISRWGVYFLVPTGRARSAEQLSAEQFEEAFETLYSVSRRARFEVAAHEAPHYYRFVLQKLAAEYNHAPEAIQALVGEASHPAGSGQAGGNGFDAKSAATIRRALTGLNNDKGFVFVSHTGDVYPSWFLPLPAGNVRLHELADIYQHSALFVDLRDPSRLRGKCGVCEFREACGGSRARAYALTGDPFAPERCCLYQPVAIALDEEESPPASFAAAAGKCSFDTGCRFIDGPK